MPVLVGILAGVAAATPAFYALHVAVRRDGHMGMGLLLACCLAPFMLLQALILVVRIVRPDDVLGFGAASALALLVSVTVAGLRAWHLMR